jgi:hypothetical protein
MIGEKPDRANCAANNNLDMVAIITNNAVKRIMRMFNFIKNIFRTKIGVKYISPSSVFLNLWIKQEHRL